MPIKALFFDAGNTLVFADTDRTLAPLAAIGLKPTQQQLFAAERAAKRRLDAARAARASISTDHSPGKRAQRTAAAAAAVSGTPRRTPPGPVRSVDSLFWDIYYTHLLGALGCSDTGVCADLIKQTRKSAHWSRVSPGTRDILDRLKRRFVLGIISNSDGHIARLLSGVGLGDCFQSFTDSAIVGFEKPDPRIFESALRSAGADARESLFVGDVYSVDYLGAKNAGMDAVLMDKAGAYRDDGLPRVESLEELEAALSKMS